MAVLSGFSEAARSGEGQRLVTASGSPTVLLPVRRQTGVPGVGRRSARPPPSFVVRGRRLSGRRRSRGAHIGDRPSVGTLRGGRHIPIRSAWPGTPARDVVADPGRSHTERTPTPLAVVVCRRARPPN